MFLTLLAVLVLCEAEPGQASNSIEKGEQSDLCPDHWWAYRIEKLSNADISDFSVYRRVYRIEPPISSISIFSKPVIFLSFSPKILRKFRKFPENSENPWTKVLNNNNNAENSKNSPKSLKICRKFPKKKVFFEALISYRIEKKPSYCIDIVSSKKKSLSTRGAVKGETFVTYRSNYLQKWPK